jgi:hypothetical protein
MTKPKRDSVTRRRQMMVKLTERQRAEFVELVDRHKYLFDEAFAVAKKVGTRVTWRAPQ